MFRKSISVSLSVLLVFTLFAVLPTNVGAAESDSLEIGAYINTENVGSYADERWQWTDECVQQERCTYRAWHEANDRLGISLPLTWGNAATWAANARRDGYSVDNKPSVNSIVCWSGYTWGHVAYVTGVDDSNIYIREGGINPSNSYPNYWFRDTSFSRSNQNRWSGYSLEGYIHLDPIPKGHVMSESEGAGRTIPDGDYWIISKIAEDYFVDIPGNDFNTNDKQNVQTWRWDSGLPPKYDVFNFTYLNNGFYKITQLNTNMAIDIYGADIKRGSNVSMWTYNGTLAQQWSIEKTSGGYLDSTESDSAEGS